MDGEIKYYEVDFPELTKVLFNRIKKLEPENAIKVMGCILLKEPSEQEMFDLAYGTDMTLSSKISDAKVMLDMLPSKSSVPVMQFGSYPPSGSRPFAHMNFHVSTPPFLGPHMASDHHLPNHSFEFVPCQFADSMEEDYSLRNQSQLFSVEEQTNNTNHMRKLYYAESPSSGGLGSRISRRSQSLSELPVKACHYFNKGYCKHGMNCRYSHLQNFTDGHIFGSDMNDLANEDNGLTPISLEKLEMEITELLRSKRGTPVSIASLPMLYYDKYGRNLQAQGYLTESQRHGKVGLSLTKLLNRLKNSIKVIDRPHGQHSVILAEDAPRYPECRNERNDSGTMVSSSHQIYLTFPAESTFTEDDVSNYFKQYGPVHDVRIPCQENRMFGFVSFLHSETVNFVLMKRNPHYICGARVLVKPYREKSRNTDRKYTERIKPLNLNYYPSHYLEMGHTVREADSLRVPKKQLVEDQEKMVDLESMLLSEMTMGSRSLTKKHILNYGLEDLKVPEDASELFIDHFSYALDTLNIGSTSDNDRHVSNSYNDHESGHIELPDSPFAPPPIGSSISAVM